MPRWFVVLVTTLLQAPTGCGGSDYRTQAVPDASSSRESVADTGALPDAPLEAGATLDAGVAPEGADAADTGCGDSVTSVVGIASAPLNEMPAIPLVESVRLNGDRQQVDLKSQQNVTAGLRWQQDRMFMLTDPGFWDIPSAGPARWYPTSTVLVLGVRAADIDGDGDEDMMLLSVNMNAGIATDATANPLMSRLAVWERTPDGLAERTEVLRSTGLIFPMPYTFGDVNGDGNLDIVTFESGTPVAYVNDGKLAFTRTILGATATEYMNLGVLTVAYADRNRDGKNDLLVVAGMDTELSIFVMLSDNSGKLTAPGPAAKGKSPLPPHGPMGTGIGIADVTGDGIADVVTQDPQSTADTPKLNLHVSTDAQTVAAAVQLDGLGFAFADVDEDGNGDIVTTLKRRQLALLWRGAGQYETRDLGISMAMPPVMGFVVDPGQGAAPAVAHVLYNLPSCPACGARCSGRCVFRFVRGVSLRPGLYDRPLHRPSLCALPKSANQHRSKGPLKLRAKRHRAWCHKS
jgi:hypothetical protein